MNRGIRLLVSTLALAGTAMPALSQQIPNPDPRKTDLLPTAASQQVRPAGMTRALTAAERQTASPIAPHLVGPTVAAAAAGVRVARAEPAALPAAPRRAEDKQNVALMVVGGAALIVGAIIGDTPGTIIMVGGAGVGLYGLYKYLE